MRNDLIIINPSFFESMWNEIGEPFTEELPINAAY